MIRAGVGSLLAGVVALLGLALLGWGQGAAAVLPSYLAAWLFWSALPIGAVAVLMFLDLVGRGAVVGAWLRPLLLTWPVVVLLALPVLLGIGVLWPWAAAPAPGFAGAWFAPEPFAIRMVVYLAVWLGLSLLVAAPAPPGARRGRAAVGLLLHAVVGTLAGYDWAMSMQPGLVAASFGLLLVASQVATATAASLLLAALVGHLRGHHPIAAAILLASAAAWGFLHFVQYLVIWSGDLPAEIQFYAVRGNPAGRLAVWVAVLDGLLLPVATIWLRRARVFGVAVAAALALLAHWIEMLWLVTPAARGGFCVTLADLLALLGVGGLAIGGALLLAGRFVARRMAAHA